MPFYEYKCKNCNNRFDICTTMEKRNIIQTCPKCNKRESIRVISVPMFDTGGSNADKLGRLDNNLKYRK